MGQFDDERTVELKAQLNSAFAKRAGKPGYGPDGWKTPGLDNQATRDEGRRMEQNQKQVMRVAQRNAVKALRAGNAEAWQFWSNQAGGKTFGVNDSQQRSETAGLGADRNAQNAFRLNGGITANPNSSPTAGYGTPTNKKRAADEIERAAKPSGIGDGSSPQYAAESSSGGEWVNVGPSPTDSSATAPDPTTAPANTIPDRKAGESSFDYAERLAQMRGKQEGVFGGDRKEALVGLKDKFSKQDTARAEADPFKEGQEDAWRNGPYSTTPEQAKEMDAAGISGKADKSGRPIEVKPASAVEKAKEAGVVASEEFLSANRGVFDDLERMTAENYDKSDPRNIRRTLLDYNESLQTGQRFDLPNNLPQDVKKELDAAFSNFVSSQLLKSKAREDANRLGATIKKNRTADLQAAYADYKEEKSKGYFKTTPEAIAEKKRVYTSSIEAYERDVQSKAPL